MTDDDGHCPICLAALEVVGTAVDVITTVRTLRDPNASTTEKAVTTVGTVAGVFLPGGGYVAGAKAIVKRVAKREAKQVVAKTADNAADANRVGKDFTKKGKEEVIEQIRHRIMARLHAATVGLRRCQGSRLRKECLNRRTKLK